MSKWPSTHAFARTYELIARNLSSSLPGNDQLRCMWCFSALSLLRGLGFYISRWIELGTCSPDNF